jgi:hypothetical protein
LLEHAAGLHSPELSQVLPAAQGLVAEHWMQTEGVAEPHSIPCGLQSVSDAQAVRQVFCTQCCEDVHLVSSVHSTQLPLLVSHTLPSLQSSEDPHLATHWLATQLFPSLSLQSGSL